MQRVVRHRSNKAAMARTVQGLGCCERHDNAGARRKRKARRVHRRRAVRHAHHGRHIIVVRRKQVHGGNRRGDRATLRQRGHGSRPSRSE